MIFSARPSMSQSNRYRRDLMGFPVGKTEVHRKCRAVPLPGDALRGILYQLQSARSFVGFAQV